MNSLTLTGKWELLPANHPTVMRRLSRELNANGWQAGRAFYYKGDKYNRAMISHGTLYVRMCSDSWIPADVEGHFDDGNGNAIQGSRTRCGH